MKKITTVILLAMFTSGSIAQINASKTRTLSDSAYKKVWLLQGNSQTNPKKDFIGTTDNQRLVFRTNNLERMTITPSGYLGLNQASPSRLFYLQNTNAQDNAEIIVNQTSGSTLGSYLTLDNRNNGGKSWSIGSTGPLNSPQVYGALEFYEYGFGTRMILDSNGRLGVGIGNGKLPTASLHVKGSVRLDGLKNNNTLDRILATDEKGNLAWRDISTIGSSQGWSLTGNAGTNPTANFIGTTDNQNLAFRVNNTERFSILTNGYTGINNPSPSKLLSLQGANTEDNAEILVKQTTGSALGAYLTLDNTANGGKWWSIGSTGTLNSPQVYGALEFYEFGFGTRMILDADGRLGLGIGNGVLPSANLHAKGTVRLESLSSGSGTPLVIDNDGYLHIGNTAVAQSSQSTELSNQISDLKKVVAQLQTQIEYLSSQVVNSNASSSLNSKVVVVSKTELNILPNPSKGNTIFQFVLADASTSSSIKIYDLNGRIIKTISIAKGQTKGSVNISAGEFKSGVYGVSLLSQSEVLQNKFLIVE